MGEKIRRFVFRKFVKTCRELDLRWFRNGREISKFNPHFIMTENYLKISEISDFDNGTYVVRADNGIQSGFSHPK